MRITLGIGLTLVLLLGVLFAPTVALAEDEKAAEPPRHKIKVRLRRPVEHAPAVVLEPGAGQRDPMDAVQHWLMQQIAGHMAGAPNAAGGGATPLHSWFDGGADVPMAGLRDALRAEGWDANQLMGWLMQKGMQLGGQFGQLRGKMGGGGSPFAGFAPGGMARGGHGKRGGGCPNCGGAAKGGQDHPAAFMQRMLRGGGGQGGNSFGQRAPHGGQAFTHGPFTNSQTIVMWNDGTGWKRQVLPGSSMQGGRRFGGMQRGPMMGGQMGRGGFGRGMRGGHMRGRRMMGGGFGRGMQHGMPPMPPQAHGRQGMGQGMPGGAPWGRMFQGMPGMDQGCGGSCDCPNCPKMGRKGPASYFRAGSGCKNCEANRRAKGGCKGDGSCKKAAGGCKGDGSCKKAAGGCKDCPNKGQCGSACNKAAGGCKDCPNKGQCDGQGCSKKINKAAKGCDKRGCGKKCGSAGKPAASWEVMELPGGQGFIKRRAVVIKRPACKDCKGKGCEDCKQTLELDFSEGDILDLELNPSGNDGGCPPGGCKDCQPGGCGEKKTADAPKEPEPVEEPAKEPAPAR